MHNPDDLAQKISDLTKKEMQLKAKCWEEAGQNSAAPADLEKQRAEKMEAEMKYRQDQMQDRGAVGGGCGTYESILDRLRTSIRNSEQHAAHMAERPRLQKELIALLEDRPELARILDLLQLVG